MSSCNTGFIKEKQHRSLERSYTAALATLLLRLEYESGLNMHGQGNCCTAISVFVVTHDTVAAKQSNIAYRRYRQVLVT